MAFQDAGRGGRVRTCLYVEKQRKSDTPTWSGRGNSTWRDSTVRVSKIKSTLSSDIDRVRTQSMRSVFSNLLELADVSQHLSIRSIQVGRRQAALLRH